MSDLTERIKAARRLRSVPVALPEWGQPEGLSVRVLTAAEVVEWEAWAEGLRGTDLATGVVVMARLARLTLVDADGARVFAEADEAWLRDDDLKVLSRVFDAAAALNGIRKKDREEIEKNSGAAGGTSPSASPSPSGAPTSTASSPG